MTLGAGDLTMDAGGCGWLLLKSRLRNGRALIACWMRRFPAPADFIKENYRTLVKRWHPDHYAAGSAEQVEAAEMTRLINEAYGK